MPKPTGAEDEAALFPLPSAPPPRCGWGPSQAVLGLGQFGAPKPTPQQAVGTLAGQGCLHHGTQHTREGQYLGGSWAGSRVKDPQILVLLR